MNELFLLPLEPGPFHRSIELHINRQRWLSFTFKFMSVLSQNFIGGLQNKKYYVRKMIWIVFSHTF